MAEREAGFYLEVYLYPAPNPALTAVLKGEELRGVVADYTSKVFAVYVQKVASRPRHSSDPHPGNMIEHTSASVHIGGYKNDRHVGEITVDVPYAAADEFGRHAYNPYEGHHDLAHSLYQILPYAP